MGCCGEGKVTFKANQGTPKIQQDGSLLFDGPAPPVPGYTIDPANRQRLVPTHPPCKFRLTQRFDQQDGSSTVMNMCNKPGFRMQGVDVAPGDCQNCDAREGNSLINL